MPVIQSLENGGEEETKVGDAEEANVDDSEDERRDGATETAHGAGDEHQHAAEDEENAGPGAGTYEQDGRFVLPYPLTWPPLMLLPVTHPVTRTVYAECDAENDGDDAGSNLNDAVDDGAFGAEAPQWSAARTTAHLAARFLLQDSCF